MNHIGSSGICLLALQRVSLEPLRQGGMFAAVELENAVIFGERLDGGQTPQLILAQGPSAPSANELNVHDG